MGYRRLLARAALLRTQVARQPEPPIRHRCDSSPSFPVTCARGGHMLRDFELLLLNRQEKDESCYGKQ